MDKNTLLEIVIEKLKTEKQDIETGLKTAKQTAVDAPGPMQSHSDTTKFQMNVLFENLKQTLEEKENSINTLISFSKNQPSSLTTVQLGSVVELKDSGEIKFYFILPAGGGIKVEKDNKIITAITPQTPLATALQGKNKGDKIKFRTKEMEIINIF